MVSTVSWPRRRGFSVALIGFIVVGVAPRASMQTPAQPSWAGWARCQVDVQGPVYTERQIHTWTSSGGTPTVEGAFRVYPGTWSVVGGGSLQRTQGTQTLIAQWAINGTMANAPLAVFVRASDGRMLLQARHAQLRAAGAIAGYQQQIIDGTPQTPGQLSGEGFEWAFPAIDAPAASTAVSGTSAPGVNGSVGFMQPGGSRGTAACTWTFGRDASAPAPPPALAAVAVPTPQSTVVTGGPAPGQTAQAPPAGGAAAGGGAAPPVAIALPPGIPTLTITPTAVALPPAVPTAIAPPVATPLPPAIPNAISKPPDVGNRPPTLLTETVLTELPLCTLRGPDRHPSKFNIFTPIAVYLYWSPVAGATAYEISRQDLGVIAKPAATVGNFTHRTALPPGTSYEYAIKAIYPQGCGVTLVTAASGAPSPSGTVRPGTAAGQVLLSWQVSKGDVYAVHVEGPGLPSGGSDSRNQQYQYLGATESVGSLLIQGVPKGTQTWTVTAVWGTGPGAIRSGPRTLTLLVP